LFFHTSTKQAGNRAGAAEKKGSWAFHRMYPGAFSRGQRRPKNGINKRRGLGFQKGGFPRAGPPIFAPNPRGSRSSGLSPFPDLGPNEGALQKFVGGQNWPLGVGSRGVGERRSAENNPFQARANTSKGSGPAIEPFQKRHFSPTFPLRGKKKEKKIIGFRGLPRFDFQGRARPWIVGPPGGGWGPRERTKNSLAWENRQRHPPRSSQFAGSSSDLRMILGYFQCIAVLAEGRFDLPAKCPCTDALGRFLAGDGCSHSFFFNGGFSIHFARAIGAHPARGPSWGGGAFEVRGADAARIVESRSGGPKFPALVHGASDWVAHHRPLFAWSEFCQAGSALSQLPGRIYGLGIGEKP